MCEAQQVDRVNPPFLDYRMLVIGWREENRRVLARAV
jgi:hypothetical protein